MDPCGERLDGEAGLLADCRSGDREALRRLYDAYRDRVYSIALHYLNGCAEAAEDATSEVFIRAFTRLDQFRGDCSLGTWLYRLTANACLDELRRRKRLRPADAVAETRADSRTDREYRRVELGEAVRCALDSLPPQIRMTVLLKHFEELSYEEIAKALNCSMGTVASRLNRAHKLLARRLAPLRGELADGDMACSPDT